MATPADRLANNLNFGALGRATELRQRLLFTLGALIVFRLGTFLPIPGINPQALQQFFEQQSSGILGIFDTFSGGALGRMGIFALGVMPYISSSIIMTLMQSAIPFLKSLKEQGSKGRRQLLQYTRYVPVLIPPSVLSVTVCLKLFRVKTWFASVNPISQGIPTYLTLV